MKKAIVAVISATCLSWPLITSAQGTPYVSNLEQTSIGNAAVGSDFWIAQIFDIDTSDPNLYTLDSLELLLNPATGSPSGFEVSLYTAPLNGAPQDYLGSLAGPADPLTGGTYTYAASGITLSGGEYYFITITSSTPTSQGAFNWSASDSTTRNGSWVIHEQYYTSSDGSSWERHLRAEVFQMAIYATVVPEPTTSVLLGFGLGIVVIMRMFPRTRSRFS